MKYATDDIVEYQFESMVLPRIGRVLEVSTNGLYVLDGRDVQYLPFAMAYIRPFYVEDREKVYEVFLDGAKSKLAAYKKNTEAKLLSMGDAKLLEEQWPVK